MNKVWGGFMIIVITKKKIISYFIVFSVILMLIIGIINFINYGFPLKTALVFNKDEMSIVIQEMHDRRNNAILKKDTMTLGNLYDRSIKYGEWAYQHELKKMKYLHSWSEKQGVIFNNIATLTKIRYVKERQDGYRINLLASTEYKYYYKNQPEKTNMFRIGTYHSIDVKKTEEGYIITREWYTDPFADSLHLDKLKSEEITNYIVNMKERDFANINDRRKSALEYANKYCGAAADEEFGLAYNKKYRDYNPLGGDCANFASQMLHEGGKFSENYTWQYNGGGSKAWVNAHAFKSYWLYSGRASKIAHGTYNQVYKHAYKLLPGDFIAYEKNGKVTHISVVTGADSKGYAYVHSHNTDRYKVPWDLGWNDSGIKFWLIRVHF